jgi:hypothetical protein
MHPVNALCNLSIISILVNREFWYHILAKSFTIVLIFVTNVVYQTSFIRNRSCLELKYNSKLFPFILQFNYTISLIYLWTLTYAFCFSLFHIWTHVCCTFLLYCWYDSQTRSNTKICTLLIRIQTVELNVFWFVFIMWILTYMQKLELICF